MIQYYKFLFSTIDSTLKQMNVLHICGSGLKDQVCKLKKLNENMEQNYSVHIRKANEQVIYLYLTASFSFVTIFR